MFNSKSNRKAKEVKIEVGLEAQNDSTIWKNIKQGNREAFSFVYQQYAPSLFSYGIRLYNDREIVNDSIQEIFINIWKYRKNLQKTNSIKNYLFKSFRREMIRKQNQFKGIELKDYALIEKCTNSQEFKIINMEDYLITRNKLMNALSNLPSRQKEVIHLKYLEEQSFQEIAEIMQINITSVYKVLYKGLNSLKKQLKKIAVH